MMPIMKIFKRSTIIFSLLLAACAVAPQKTVAGPSAPAPAPDLSQQALEETPQNLPKVTLSGDMLYEFLLGDIASDRGQFELAAQLYMDLAKNTQDPRVARRAAQLAFDAHDVDKSVEALDLWLRLDPASHQAKQLLVTMLLSEGKLEEARPHLVEILAAYPGQAGHTLGQVYGLLLRYPDRQAVFKFLTELAAPYQGLAEAHMVLSQAAMSANLREEAMREIQRARALRPEWEMAAMFEAQLLQQDAPQQSAALLKGYLADYPDANDARLLYARLLLEQKQYAPARAEFRHLLEVHPESADLAYAVAMLSMEMGELDSAETELRQALSKGKKDDSTVYYYLGQLNEEKKRDDEALKNYYLVTGGEYAYPARLRAAYLLSKSGKLNEALDYLRKTEPENNQQRVQLWLIEAQLLQEAKQVDAAFQVLQQGLEKLPNHPDLLYEAAMLADMLGKYDMFEQMMRKVIEINPDQAQAYNALGYSLLDRNERVPEAMQLVEKANQLAPDDAGIIDSVGWGYYREGNLAKSLEYLKRAYGADPDPEIAAHLGEVLWVQGDKEQAKKIWNDALKRHPDNAALLATLKRLNP